MLPVLLIKKSPKKLFYFQLLDITLHSTINITQLKFKVAILEIYKKEAVSMHKLLLVPLFTFSLCANAYIIDYNAINDDDNVNNFGTNSINYSIDGYKKNEQNVTSVKHDPRRGVYIDTDADSSGLKLEGVSKEDLESLSYGKSLY